MPVTRKWRTKDGSVRTQIYTTINGVDANEYAQEQSRRYHNKKREQRTLEKRQRRATAASQMPRNVCAQIVQLHNDGISLRQISITLGISRYLVTKMLAEQNSMRAPHRFNARHKFAT